MALNYSLDASASTRAWHLESLITYIWFCKENDNTKSSSSKACVQALTNLLQQSSSFLRCFFCKENRNANYACNCYTDAPRTSDLSEDGSDLKLTSLLPLLHTLLTTVSLDGEESEWIDMTKLLQERVLATLIDPTAQGNFLSCACAHIDYSQQLHIAAEKDATIMANDSISIYSSHSLHACPVSPNLIRPLLCRISHQTSMW